MISDRYVTNNIKGTTAHCDEDQASSSIQCDRAANKTPTEAIFDVASAIRSLFEPILSDIIVISPQAWNIIGYLVFLVIVYYFKEPIFTEAFWPLVAILVLSVISEIVIRNYPRLNRKFTGTTNFDEICTKGLSEENIVNSLKKCNIDNSSLDRLLTHLDLRNNVSVRIVEALVENQVLSTRLVSKILNEDPPSSTLIKLLWNNKNTLRFEQQDKIYNKWKDDKGVLCACLMTQSVAADLIANKLGESGEIFRRYNVRYSSLAPILRKAFYFIVLPIMIIVAFLTYYPTNNLVTASSYAIITGIISAIYLALIWFIDEIMKLVYYYTLKRSCIYRLSQD